MILLLDNYDSFTHNLAHLLRASGASDLEIRRCDQIDLAELHSLQPRAVVLSPGPGRPGDRGIGLPLVRVAPDDLPILGVCLGHQTIAVAFGATLTRCPKPVHGHAHFLEHNAAGAFRGSDQPTAVMRYHSLMVDRESLPSCLAVTATLKEDPNLIMGLRHRTRPIEGFQFHPESFLSPIGPHLIRNFLESL